MCNYQLRRGFATARLILLTQLSKSELLLPTLLLLPLPLLLKPLLLLPTLLLLPLPLLLKPLGRRHLRWGAGRPVPVDIGGRGRWTPFFFKTTSESFMTGHFKAPFDPAIL